MDYVGQGQGHDPTACARCLRHCVLGFAMEEARRPLQTCDLALFTENTALRAVSAVGLLAWCFSSWQQQGVPSLLTRLTVASFASCWSEKPDTPAGRRRTDSPRRRGRCLWNDRSEALGHVCWLVHAGLAVDCCEA